MPIARFELPDGRIGRFEVPDGTTPEQAMQLISSNLSSLIPKEEPAQQVEAPAAPTANSTPAPPAVSTAAPTAAPTAGKPWWAPFAESATGEAELGKQLGPKVLGGPFVQDVAAALQNTPTYAKAAAQAVAGGNTPEDLTSQTDWRHDTIAEARNLSKQNAKDPALQEEYILGITRQKIQELPQNAMFSVISMGAGLAAGAAGLVAGPVSAYAAGTAASGLAAYRMDTNGFLRDIREHLDEGSIKATGKPLTDKQWLDYAKQYNSLVQEHGLWEAVPEALGNALGAKLGATIFKEAGKGLLGTLKSFGATALEFVNELGTETVTQTGQHNTEIDAGLSNQPKRSFVNPSDIAQSAKEVLPDVLLLSGMMAGGAHIAGKVYDNTNFGQNKQIADAIKENVKSGDFSPDKIRKEAIARLDPNSYNQELIQPAETVDRNKRLPAVIAPPEQPPEDTQQVEPRVEAAPSESQNTQAMLDELSGKNIDEAGVEKPKETFKVPAGFGYTLLESPSYGLPPLSVEDADFELDSLQENAKKGRMTPERFAQSEIGKRLDTTQIMQINDGLRIDPVKTIQDLRNNILGQKAPVEPKVEETKVEKTPKLPPKVEQVASFPMGENTEYHVLKTPTGYTANMFDKDAGKYVPGSAKMFPTKTFGDEAQTKAVDYVKEQVEKAAKFNPVEKPQEVEALPAKTPEEPKATELPPAIEPSIKVGKSKLTPAPILEKLAQPAIDGINNSNNLVNQLTEAMPTAKDPGAHQQAIDNLNNTAIILNDKGQAAVDEMARNNKKTPGEQNRAIQKAGAELKKALIEHNKSLNAAKKLITPTKARVKKVPAPLELKNKTEEQLDLEERNKDLEYAERARRQIKTSGLFGALKGDLTAGEVIDISPEERFTKLKSKSGGESLSDIVLTGRLDAYLPNEMRHDAPDFDDKESAEYIKERLRQYNYMTFDAEQELEKITGQIEELRGNIKELEDEVKQQLELKDVNLLLEEAFNEQREADLANAVIEPADENRVPQPSETELALTGQTPDEVRAAERAKEDRLKADKEAEAKAKADEGVEDFTLTGSNRPADIAAAQGQESLFGESSEQKALAEVKKGLVRFASGMSGLSDLETGARARSGHLNYGVGVDVGLLSNNAIDSIANAILNSSVPIFIDSGAFSNFRQNLKGNGPKPLDFNKILAKYDQITEAIQNQNEEERTDYPRPIIVMPDVVGDQAASLELIKQHKSWIIPEIKFNVTQPMIPIQKGELTLSQVYDELVNTLGTDDFIVGVPSQAEAVSKSELTEFLRESQPKKIHFLGAASDKKLTPLLNIVATESPDTKVTADASKVRSAILDGVAQGKTREQAIMDALMEEEDPGVLLDKFGPQLTDESNVIDGTDLVREIGKEKQLLLIADESNKLSANETAALEEEYGAKRGSNEFLERLHADVFNFITQGAKSIKNRIRPIINKIANSLLSVAIVLNPSFITKPNIIAVPQYETRTEAVYAEVPKEAKARMSPAAQQIYSVVYPAIKAELIENNKFFIVTDKPMARNFIFNPDGSLLMDKKVLLSKSMGDFLPAGSNDIDANKITPAGLYNLGLRDASRSKGEAETAGEYDYGKVFVIEHAGEGRHGPYSMTIMHSVWTHEKDAAQRLAALKTEAPNVSRYSFGCINVDKATFGDLVKNHLSQMDGAKLFIVPDSATNAMDFVNGKATYRDDMMRQRVEPITKEVKTPIKEARAVENEKMAAREEKFYNIVQFEPEFEEEKKRNPSFKRAVTGLNKYRNKGMLTDEEFALKVAEELDADNNRKSNELTPSRKRGILHIKSRMNAEANRGTISKEAVDLAEWFMNQNPSLVDDLGISIKAKELGTGGFYNSMARVMTLMKYGGNEETPVHEILHHTERMMPTDIQNSIRKEWLQQLLKAQKNAKTPEEKIYFAALMNGHFDDNNSLNIVVKDKSGNVDKSVNKFLFDSIGAAKAFTGSRPNSMELAKFLLQNSDLPIENYRFMNPSEFWAVNGSRIVAGDYASVQGSILTKLKNWLGKLAEKIKSLFGFRSDAPIIRALESLSKSDGRFKTKDMLGAGEYKSINQIQGQMFPAAPAQQVGSNISGQQGNMFPPGPPSKRNVFGGPAPKNSWELAPETKLGHLINTLDYKIHDKHVDTRQVQAAITKNAGLIDDTFDAYMKEELYHSRTANEIKDFLKKDLSPIIGDLIKDRLSIDDLEQYLHNRHAEERNDAIAQINPRFADVDNEPGSGIGTKAARDYFKNLDPTKAAQLAKIAAKVDDIIKGTQKILVDRGLETQQTIDNWNGAYKHYIPLMRDQEELDFMHNGAGLGKGFQVKGSASKRAYGSTKSVVDILANIAIQRESAIIRSEKARIGRALYGLALKNPNPDFWLPVNPDAIKNKAALYQELIAMGLPISVAQNFIQEPKTPSIDPLTGQVRYTINAGLRSSPNVFPVRINGKDRYIFFNTKDPKAIRMAQAMSNLDAQTLGGLLGTTALITRWIASVNTQYNPVFGVVNFYRDTKGAMLNMTNTPLAGMQKEVLSHVFPAMFAIIQNERASRNNKTVTNPYSVLYDRFRRAGGTTGFREAFAKGNFSGKDTTIIERLWKEETQGAAMKKARYIFDALSDYNEAMENAVRLSIFKVALDHNLSEERAASLGKNITINFNRKGQSTPLFQALYAFFNPAVQGTVLVGKTLAGPAGRKIVAGGLAIGVLQALWMAAAGFDADEPPDYIRDKNFIIPIGNKKYLTLPMPPGYNVIPGLSRIITEYILGQNHLISGGKPLTDAAAQILTLFLDSFNPLGGGSLLQMVSPTVIDPIAATAMNKDAFGRPIFKEDLSTKPTPGFMRSRENATQVSQWIAEFLNYVSSPAGTHYTKGKWSPTADEIDYYAGQVGGGAAREVIKAAELAKSAFTSEPVPSYRIPLAGRFYGDAKSQSAIQDKFYNNITLMNKYGNEITNIQKSGQDPSKYMRAHPEAQLYNAASNFNNTINEMNKNKKNMLKNKLPLKDIREYEAQKYQIMKTFNDQVASAQKQR